VVAARDSRAGLDATVSDDEEGKAGPQAVQRLTIFQRKDKNDDERSDGLTVKGQLAACRDSLMAGMRSATRGPAPNERASSLMRACLDLVEHLTRQATEVSVAEVNTTLGVLDQAMRDMENEGLEAHPSTAALRNAIARLQVLKQEMAVK
jgi:hypothetical protein